jgi:hypothetical protein
MPIANAAFERARDFAFCEQSANRARATGRSDRECFVRHSASSKLLLGMIGIARHVFA